MDVDEALGSALVPPLSIQPLVENAVVHGLSTRPQGGSVALTVTRHLDDLVVSVEDPGPGPGGSAHAGSEISLAELELRLALLYGDRASVGLEPGPDGAGCVARIVIPLEHTPGKSSARTDR